MNVDIQIFESVLEDGEYVEWVGRTKPFPLIDATNKKRILERWIGCVAFAIILIVAYFISISNSSAEVMIGVPVVIVCAAILVAIMPLLDKKALEKKVVYSLTNNRALVHKAGSSGDGGYFSISLDSSADVKIISKNGGVSDVLFGAAAVNAPEQKLRRIALIPKVNEESEKEKTTGIVFYNIDDVDVKKIKELLDKKPGS